MLNLSLSIAAQNGVSACFFWCEFEKRGCYSTGLRVARSSKLKGRVLPCDHDMPFFLVFWIVFDDTPRTTIHIFERIVVSRA
jgi:hypothetical protein